MKEMACTTEEFTRILAHGDIPRRLASGSYLEALDFRMDELTAEYVRRTMHEFFGGMKIPEKRRLHVVRSILYCAELQGLVFEDNGLLGLTFVSTKRLSEFWDNMYGQDGDLKQIVSAVSSQSQGPGV